MNGKYGFPNHDSELVALEKKGFRKVFGDMADQYFWSSSVHPVNDYDAYDFNGNNGNVDNYTRDISLNSDSARCVSAAGVN